MKLTSILKITAISLTALLASCGEKKDDHSGHDHDHSGHDHDHDHGKKGKTENKAHDHKDGDHDHSKCGVKVGPKGGRMIQEIAELNLTEDGKITLAFVSKPADGTKVTILKDGSPLELTQSENVYTSAAVVGKLPAELHVAIKESAGKKTVEKFKLEMGKCTKCGNAKLACTCHNHDHHDHHDHDDHEGHDHGDHEGHSH